jgi:hypothetical protein
VIARSPLEPSTAKVLRCWPIDANQRQTRVRNHGILQATTAAICAFAGINRRKATNPES